MVCDVDCSDVFGCVTYDGDDDQTDERLGQPGSLHNLVNGADQIVCTYGDHDSGEEENGYGGDGRKVLFRSSVQVIDGLWSVDQEGVATRVGRGRIWCGISLTVVWSRFSSFRVLGWVGLLVFEVLNDVFSVAIFREEEGVCLQLEHHVEDIDNQQDEGGAPREVQDLVGQVARVLWQGEVERGGQQQGHD